MGLVVIDSPNVKYTEEYIETKYKYQNTEVQKQGDRITVKPVESILNIRTERKVPKLGLMLIGWGGNNGSTLTAAILANLLQLNWHTRRGVQKPNWYGSIVQASTVYLGLDENKEPVFVPLNSILPFINPDDLIIDGWDISSANLAEAMQRSKVLDYDLQRQLIPHLKKMRPRKAVYNLDFIAANQNTRADNVLSGTLWEQMQQIQADIRQCKNDNNLDKIIVMWTANTERFSEVTTGINDTADNLLQTIKANNTNLIAPSTLYAVAAILEGVTFINGSPQNTFVPGCVQLAEIHKTFIAGDDFKSGQTKLKSVLVDFLIGAGIKPVSIVSYNHLGNNDGKNLSSPQQFRSKEISKSNVVDDMVGSNSILYKPGEKPDHVVVIKYVPYVGDSKRAMDEYTSEILLGGHNTLIVHNTCEDSLLAAPIILDLVLIAELCQRITFKNLIESKDYHPFHTVLSILSYMCKAPMVPDGAPVVNSLFRQKACIENVFKACVGLPPDNNMQLEHKVPEVFAHIGYNGHII